MTTTTTTSSAPKPVESAAKPTQPGARAQDRKGEAADIFANLLSLLASTQVLPEAATVSSAAPGDGSTTDKDKPDGTDNPLTALMAWGLPGAADAALGKRAGAQGAEGSTGLPGAAGSADRATASADGKIDISGMTPVEPAPLETASKGAVALPANAVRAGTAFVPTARTADTATGSTTATPWRHASLAGTETLAIQQAANQTSQVRSTVALNERFGLAPGVPLGTAELREAAGEGFSLSSATGTGARTPEGATALPGTVSGEGAGSADHNGSDAGGFDQTDAPADNPFAEANAAEEPTVTHWGTQHLRHASLSVAGEAGEQAIDIQLSMKGQEVQVEFKTDNAEARASLRENAGESLGDLLNKSGMQLGGVSVGAQSQQGSRGDGAAARQNGVRGVASGPQATAAAPSRPAQAAPRADGSQPLDVFA
ncbi:flagellar hook-length control protein FliK [Hydrogenophaga sp.]|uniref:flagellar hook-length control protein FliK n=1 Tax=Hydrogenophaga sp. TaxID=1904254 RepID=UPI00272FDBAE|nr:flagellar hook-length control protein FliK [Hydrogenophaga sp.]MDP1684671.1 flagellar hook-length control protein FliK [Hydrogenophaga sp.]